MKRTMNGMRLSKYLFAFMILLIGSVGTASASNIRGVENADLFGYMNISQSWLCVDDDQAGCVGTTAGTAYANDFVCNSAGCIGKEELGTGSVEADELASGAVTAAGTELDSTVAGDGIGLSGGAITVQVNTTSGLELFNDRIALIGSCDDEEVLSWDNDNGIWECVAMGAYDDTDLWTNASVQEAAITANAGDITDLWTNASVQEGKFGTIDTSITNLWANASDQEGDITTLEGEVTNLWTNASVQETAITTNAGEITDLWTNASSQEGRITTLEGVGDIYVDVDGDTMTGELIIDDQLNVTGDFWLGGDMYGSGADVAEKFASSERLEAGDVVSIKNMVISKSAIAFDYAVIGVVSTDPVLTMGAERKGTAIAMTGTTPVKVTDEGGKIQSGDLLTSSSKEGYAMKCESREKCIGAIIGKATQDFSGARGTIRMLVMMG